MTDRPLAERARSLFGRAPREASPSEASPPGTTRGAGRCGTLDRFVGALRREFDWSKATRAAGLSVRDVRLAMRRDPEFAREVEAAEARGLKPLRPRFRSPRRRGAECSGMTFLRSQARP
ncbi:MAG TPA: hypothetical protein VFI25_02315 [Planctomycetota bacterium]|nr:hypothetical protein [Planctomycetota bacterium]